MLRGEVWLINLDPTLGSEIKKTRPAVIVPFVEKDNEIFLKTAFPSRKYTKRYRLKGES